MSRATLIGAWLLFITALLVGMGCVLYVSESIGWAQLCWVMASGTAGGGIVLFVEDKP